MSKKTLLLIIFLFLVTCGLLYLAVVTPPYQKKLPTAPTPTPLSVNAHTILSMTPAEASQSSRLTKYTLAVHIDTGENVVNSVQLEVAYDPKALTDVTIGPGDFFQQPNALLNNVDTTNGRISYALTEQLNLPGKKGKGTLALISFNLAPTFIGTTTTLSFLPKTAIAADRIMESVLRQATGYTLTITPSTTPTQSVGTQSAK